MTSMVVTAADKEFIVAEAQTFLQKIPFPIRPFIPTLGRLLSWIPGRLENYTVREIREAIEELNAQGRIPSTPFAAPFQRPAPLSPRKP